MSKMTVYAQKSCDACRELVPVLERLTRENGIAMEVVDVDKCHTKKCDEVKYTPTIVYRGKEVKSAGDLKKILGKKLKARRSVRRRG